MSRQILTALSLHRHNRYKGIHQYEVTEAATHDKQVKDLMTSKAFVCPVKNRKLKCINDAADGIDNSTCKQPPKCCTGQVVDDIRKCEHAHPAHGNINHR